MKNKKGNARNRIIETKTVLASSLIANPKNWRVHPKEQADAVRGIIDEIGIVAALTARKMPDGTLMLIDGHLRAEILPTDMVPVNILDVTEEEADKLLLSLDPLAAMAESNALAIEELAKAAHTNNSALQEMWNDLQNSNAVKVEALQAEAMVTEDEYNNSIVRQIVLIFSQDQYETVVASLGEYADKHSLGSNSEVFLHLLEASGYATSGSVTEAD
jgi:hypothetical protein